MKTDYTHRGVSACTLAHTHTPLGVELLDPTACASSILPNTEVFTKIVVQVKTPTSDI